MTAPSSTASPTSWTDDVKEGRFRAARAAMPAWPEADARPSIAELARFGEAARSDLIAQGVRAEEPAAVADAIRELRALGAEKTAAHYLGLRGEAERAAIERELAADRPLPMRRWWDWDDAVLERLAASPSPAERALAARALGGRKVAELDFAGALARLDAAEATSSADASLACATDACLVALAAGEVDRARALAKAIAGRDAPRGEALEDMIGEGAKPEWTRASRSLVVASRFDGRGVIEALGLAPAGDAPQPQAAHLEDALRRRLGQKTLRARLDVAKVERALAAGAIVILEEERPMRTAFRLVLAAAPSAKLLVVRDPERREANVVPDAWQASRSSLFARGAIVVLPEDSAPALLRLAAADVVDDAALRALDRTWLDDDGATPTLEATIAKLRAVVEADGAAIPAAHAWLGDVLLEAAVRDIGPKDDVTAWYAEVKERFPTMEAPSQTYARYLERWGSPPEVGVAWASAAHKDELDARNALGWGRALKRMGRTDEAYVRFRDALRLDPDEVSVYGWLSTCHFAKDDFAGAELWARVSGELQPQNRSARSLLADALEAQGAAAAAEAPLREAWELGKLPEDGTRVARATFRAGDAKAARDIAVDVARRAGGGEAWSEAVHLALAVGDDAGAWDLARTVARHPRPQGWFHTALDGAMTLAPSEDVARERVQQLVDLAGRDVPALCDVGIELAWRGYSDLARLATARLEAVAPDDPNTPWGLARVLLRGDRLHDDAPWKDGATPRQVLDEAMNRLVEQLAPGFVPVRAVACANLATAQPKRAIELATHASFVEDPKSWLVQAVALRGLGEVARAEALEKRLASLDGSALALVSDFYRFYRFWDLSGAAMNLVKDDVIDQDKYLSLERAALDLRKDPSRAALDRARAAWRRFDWLPATWLCQAAAATGQADALAADAPEVAAGFTKSSSRGGDTWIYRAWAAAARAKEDGGAERAAILERLPEHPWVRAVLAIGGRGLGGPHADEDRAALEARCPVSARVLLTRWGRP